MKPKQKNIWMLVVLLAGGFLSLFNETILNIALTDLMHVMNVDASTVQWLATGYMLIVVIMVPLSAPLLRTFSVKTLYTGAMSIFLIGTIIAACANDFPILLTARMIQALGTGLLAPIMMSAAVAVTLLQKRGAVMALCTSIILVGPSFGPIVSGVILQFTTWRVLFILLIPLIILCLIGGQRFLGTPLRLTKPKIDFVSVGLIAGGLAFTVYAISSLDSAIPWLIKIGSLVIGIGLLIVFSRRQRTLKQPLLNLRVFKNSIFSSAVFLVVLIQMIQFAMNIVLPMILEGGQQLSPLRAALVLFPAAISCAIVTLFAGRYYDGRGGRGLILSGLIIMVIAICLQLTIKLTSSVIMIMGFNSLLYIGIGLMWSPNQSDALSLLSERSQTDGVAIINTAIQLGSALGTPVFVGLLSAGEKQALSSKASQAQALFAGFHWTMWLALGSILVCLLLAEYKAKKMSLQNYKLRNNNEGVAK